MKHVLSLRQEGMSKRSQVKLVFSNTILCKAMPNQCIGHSKQSVRLYTRDVPESAKNILCILYKYVLPLNLFNLIDIGKHSYNWLKITCDLLFLTDFRWEGMGCPWARLVALKKVILEKGNQNKHKTQTQYYLYRLLLRLSVWHSHYCHGFFGFCSDFPVSCHFPHFRCLPWFLANLPSRCHWQQALRQRHKPHIP